MLKLLAAFVKANREDCWLYLLTFSVLGVFSWVMWGTQLIYLVAPFAVMAGVSLGSDFLKWRAYYGHFYSDRG